MYSAAFGSACCKNACSGGASLDVAKGSLDISAGNLGAIQSVQVQEECGARYCPHNWSWQWDWKAHGYQVCS